MSKQASRSDLYGGLGWVAFGLLVLFESLRMDRFTKMGATLYTMPGFMPGMLGCILIVLGAALAWRSWSTVPGTPLDTPLDTPLGIPLSTQSSTDLETPKQLFNHRIVTALPLCLLYAAGLIGLVPFWLATTVFLTVFTYYFSPKDLGRNKRIFSALASGVITTVIVIGVFQYVFLVRLP